MVKLLEPPSDTTLAGRTGIHILHKQAHSVSESSAVAEGHDWLTAGKSEHSCKLT